jgi:hypothetical protein
MYPGATDKVAFADAETGVPLIADVVQNQADKVVPFRTTG